MTLISHTRRFPSTKLGIIKTAAVSYPRKTNRPCVKCNSTGNSSCKCLDYSRIFRMINLFSCTARSTTQQPTTCLQNIAETWTCQLFPSMVYAIHTHRCCCSPAYRSPACHASRPCQHDYNSGNLSARHSRAGKQGCRYRHAGTIDTYLMGGSYSFQIFEIIEPLEAAYTVFHHLQ